MARIEEEKTITVTKEVIVGFECEICGKIHNGEKLPEEWFEFTSQHYEWGNDSCDSVEEYTTCSFDCFISKLEEICDLFDRGNRKSGLINEMPYKYIKQIIAIAIKEREEKILKSIGANVS